MMHKAQKLEPTQARPSISRWRTAVLTLLLVCVVTPCFARLSAEQAEELYREGQDALAEGRYAVAADHFRDLGREESAQVDRALYWQAYAEAKAERRQAALSTLELLTGRYPESPWLDDARALQVELGGVTAEHAAAAGDDELKLYALDALMQADPDRAVELLESFLAKDHSDRLKQRALFVLSQTNSPKAAELLTSFARNSAKQDLQREAIMALGISGEPSALDELATIYRSSDDAETKQLIFQALMASASADLTLDLALAETDEDLRRQALQILAAMGAKEQIDRLAESLGPDHRADLFRAYGIAGEVEPLVHAIQHSQDPEEVAQALEGLAIAGFDEEQRQILLEVYRTHEKRSVKESVLRSFMIQNDAKALIGIFRTEKDPGLKRQALQFLSLMDEPEVQSLVEELLED